MTDLNLITQLQANKNQAYKWQERRHPQWAESYELYRDIVVVNRLIQRQSINIPLMKETIRTLLAKFRRRTDLKFEDLAGDKQKEIFKNEYWTETVKTAKLRAKDVVNRKQVLLYGRTFWKLLIDIGRPNAEVADPHDILIDRHADPADIDGTAQDIIHLHIYRRLKDLENNSDYDKDAIDRLKAFYSTKEGLVKAQENAESAQAKAERMEAMGVPDALDPQVGETYVELNEHYVRQWSETEKRFVFHLVTVADSEILRNKPLEEVLGKLPDRYWSDHTPFVSWADDLERLDTWSDGVADIIRTINKVLNAWFSQLVENRTLRNFGMNFYNVLAKEGWTPQSMDPIPGGWYPLPGKPGEVYQRVDVPDLSESLDEMQFLISLAERATAATASQKGTSEKAQITLGEVQLLLAEAEDRINDLQEPYEESWLEFGEKWSRLVTGRSDLLKPVMLYKKSYKGNYFSREIKPSDWLSKTGYACSIKSKADTERDAITAVQKLLAVRAQFPQNIPFKKLVDRRLLELVDLAPEEIKEVEQFEDKLLQQPPVPPPGSQPAPAGKPAPQPVINTQQNEPARIAV